MLNQLITPSIANSSIHISGNARPAKQDATFPLHIHNEFEILAIYEGKTIYNIYNNFYIFFENTK